MNFQVTVKIGDGILDYLELDGVWIIATFGVAFDEDEAVLIVVVGFPLYLLTGLQ